MKILARTGVLDIVCATSARSLRCCSELVMTMQLDKYAEPCAARTATRPVSEPKGNVPSDKMLSFRTLTLAQLIAKAKTRDDKMVWPRRQTLYAAEPM